MRCTWHSTIFQSKENGFTICRYATEEPSIPAAARSKFSTAGRIMITAKGYNLPTTDAVDFELTGQWEDSKYGLQLSVESFQEVIPPTKEGIIGYLSSGLIKGIGPKTAAAIYKAFGLQTMEVLENRPRELLNIRGISPQKLETIQASFQESRALRDIVARLSPYGISVRKLAKVLEAFGGNAMDILQNQPFRLCEIKGFGFKIVDAIARAVRCSPSDPLRIGGGLCYLLDEAEQAGHLFLPYRELLQKAHLLLNNGFSNEEIQNLINPPDPHKKGIKYGAQVFRELDKVIQTKNREAVSNGDVGLIVSITQDEEEGNILRVLFSDERAVDYTVEELSQLELA